MESLQHVELATGSDPRGSVIWLHGLGAEVVDRTGHLERLRTDHRVAAEDRREGDVRGAAVLLDAGDRGRELHARDLDGAADGIPHINGALAQ